MSGILELILFPVLLVISATLAAIESSLVGVSRLRAKSLFKQGKPGADALVRLKDHPRRLLATILLWSSVVSVSATAVATVLLTNAFGPSGVGLAVLAVTFVLLLFGEITPKAFASTHMDGMALLFAPLVEVLVAFSKPLIIPLEEFIRLISIAFGKEPKKPLLTEDDLDALVSIGVEEGTVGINEARLVRDALDFNDQIVDHVMTPANEVEYISSAATVKKAMEQSIASRHHRFPVRDGRGSVVGMVHEKMLLDANARGRGEAPVTAVMLAPVMVRRHTPISAVFEMFQKRKRKMAVVVDDNAKYVGVVTLEDIIEEIIDDLRNIEAEPLATHPK